jgi:hypothetical protein
LQPPRISVEPTGRHSRFIRCCEGVEERASLAQRYVAFAASKQLTSVGFVLFQELVKDLRSLEGVEPAAKCRVDSRGVVGLLKHNSVLDSSVAPCHLHARSRIDLVEDVLKCGIADLGAVSGGFQPLSWLLSQADRAMLLSFLDALVTKTRLRNLTSGMG